MSAWVGCNRCKGVCELKFNNGDPYWVCQACRKMVRPATNEETKKGG